jgi:hypothetical protein
MAVDLLHQMFMERLAAGDEQTDQYVLHFFIERMMVASVPGFDRNDLKSDGGVLFLSTAFMPALKKFWESYSGAASIIAGAFTKAGYYEQEEQTKNAGKSGSGFRKRVHQTAEAMAITPWMTAYQYAFDETGSVEEGLRSVMQTVHRRKPFKELTDDECELVISTFVDYMRVTDGDLPSVFFEMLLWCDRNRDVTPLRHEGILAEIALGLPFTTRSP